MIAKEIFDKVVALIALIILLPLFLVMAILIKLDSKGPVFFLQERVGKDGKIFKIIKFRSMVAKLRVPICEVFLDDPDVTRIGRFMRRFQIDELPQLINVLKCDMTVVGPRSILPSQISTYTPWEKKRFLMKPGMTGWAAVNGNKYMTWSERIKYDVYYVEHWSFLLDLKIIWRTFFVIIFGERRFYKDTKERIDK